MHCIVLILIVKVNKYVCVCPIVQRLVSICGASESLPLVASVVRVARGITSFLLVPVFESMLCIFSSYSDTHIDIPELSSY